MISFADFTTRYNASIANKILLVTTHFNPCSYQRCKETYYEWIPSLGKYADNLVCMEMTIDDHPSEIRNSFVSFGCSANNILWQKEALINHAIEKYATSNIEYIAWLDHDLLSSNPNWITDSVRLLEKGIDAVQCFDNIYRLSSSNSASKAYKGTISRMLLEKNKNIANPGASWIATKSFLSRLRGLYSYNIVGGGDATFAEALLGDYNYFSRLVGNKFNLHISDYITHGLSLNAKYGYVNNDVYHIWHGDIKNRNYDSRHTLLKLLDFNPSQDVFINSDGILEWSDHIPIDYRNKVVNYFLDRQEDGIAEDDKFSNLCKACVKYKVCAWLESNNTSVPLCPSRKNHDKHISP